MPPLFLLSLMPPATLPYPRVWVSRGSRSSHCPSGLRAARDLLWSRVARWGMPSAHSPGQHRPSQCGPGPLPRSRWTCAHGSRLSEPRTARAVQMSLSCLHIWVSGPRPQDRANWKAGQRLGRRGLSSLRDCTIAGLHTVGSGGQGCPAQDKWLLWTPSHREGGSGLLQS